MATEIEMPKLSDTMTVGTLVKWLKNEGDEVANGDILAEVETDKATMELESFDDGFLLKQMVAEGDEVAVGTPIAVVGEKGEKVETKSKPSADKQPKEKEEESAAEEKPAQEEASQPEGKADSKASREEKSSSSKDKTSGDGRVKVSPLARNVAANKGIDLSTVQGSGPGGRIVKADVLAAESSQPAASGTAPSAVSSSPVTISGGEIAPEAKHKVSGMRGTIARRLLESKTQIPHFYLEIEVQATALLETRAQLNKALSHLPPEKGGAKLSVNDFIMKASAEALRRVPAVNCSWQGDHIHQHPDAHVSFAVAVEDGLVTPVIRSAQNKSLRQISSEVKSLAKRARDKKLKPDEFTGGTFCVSNLGMFGITRFNAIINPPNAAILAVGATRRVPIVKDDQSIVAGDVFSLTLSCDHRVVDGAVGATFLQALKELLETPALMLV